MENNSKNQTTAQLQKIAKIFPNPFYWLDLKQRYLGVNIAGIKTIGAKSFKESFFGKTPLDIYPTKMAEEIIAHHKIVIKTKRSISEKETIKDLVTKETKIFNATLAPLYNDQGSIIGVFGCSIPLRKLTNSSISSLLSLREMQCLSFIFFGYSASMTSEVLFISTRTVEKHVDSTKKKLNCKNKKDLIGYIIKNNLIDLLRSVKYNIELKNLYNKPSS